MKEVNIFIKLLLSLVISMNSISCTQLLVGGTASGGIILVQERSRRASSQRYNNKN